MQVIFPLLFALYASAFPTNTTDILEKRSEHPWIGNSPGGYDCTDKADGPRPKLREECVNFTPQETGQVNIFWGSGVYIKQRVKTKGKSSEVVSPGSCKYSCVSIDKGTRSVRASMRLGDACRGGVCHGGPGGFQCKDLS